MVDDNTQAPFVRVVVRKETNFQNRRILFDSSSVKRHVMTDDDLLQFEKFDDIANNFGYQVNF